MVKKYIGNTEEWDGYKRMAAAVLVRGFKDYLIWHSEKAKKYREKRKRNEAIGGKMRGSAQEEFWNAAIRPDPYKFLTTDSKWHQLMDVTPEMCKAVLEDKEKIKNLIASLSSRYTMID